MASSTDAPHQAMTPRRHRVLDLISTHESARELLAHRVLQVKATGRFDNEIYCGPGEYVEQLRAQGITVHVVDAPRRLQPLRMLRAIVQTVRLLRRGSFDIVHTHTSVVGMIGRVAACLARVPIVIHQVHGFHHHENMPMLKRWVFVTAERLLARITDGMLFQNQTDIADCRRRGIAPERKIVWIGNGVRLDAFDPHSRGQQDPPMVLCVGRLEPVKNHIMLFEAAVRLKQRGVRFTAALAGDGVLRADYEAWVRARGLEGQIAFLGYRGDVPALIARATVCVLVSIKEGIPRALMEAAAGGRPSVATDVIGNRDSVVDGVTGYLVPLNDSAALADRMERILSDEALRRRMGNAAHEHAVRHFDERAVTERIIAVYDNLLTQSKWACLTSLP